MAEGLTVIAAGLLVVLCIILAMFAFIEVILKLDQVLRNRTERARAREEARANQAASTPEVEASARQAEVTAAIGLALHLHLSRGVAMRSTAAKTGSGPTTWASSGRLGIMTERQRLTSRRS
jgi:ABC-type protease/lipase transport system fused ATPase/permease subunit